MAATLSTDERSTLEAALAFIDAHYDASRSKATARSRSNVQAAARSNRQKRAELLQLRESVTQLEATRDVLVATTRRPGRRTSAQASEGDASRRRRAERLTRAVAAAANAEALKLSEARALNKRLRAVLDQQRGVSAALVQVLKKRLDQKCVQELLREASLSTPAIVAPTDPLNAAPMDRRVLLPDLSARLRAFVAEADSVFSVRNRELVLAESRTRAYRHAELGPVVEMISTTHVAGAIDDAWEYMMGAYRDANVTVNRRAVGYRFQSRPTTELGVSEKEYAMEFPDTAGYAPVHGYALFESACAPDWRLFIWTGVVAIHSDGTQVRERGWTAMTRSAAGRCVLHMRYEVYSASGEWTKAPDPQQHEQQQQRRRFLAESLLQKARHDFIFVEDALAARFGSNASGMASLFT